jgi:outer membrane protein assembly factor BamB
MNGPIQNASVMSLNVNGSNLSVIENLYPVDISVDAVDGEIFVLTLNNSVLSISSGTIKQVVSFDSGIPVALDVFEVFAYVIFDSGVIIQASIHGGKRQSICYSGLFICFDVQ